MNTTYKNRPIFVLISLLAMLNCGTANALRSLAFGDFMYPNGVWSQIASDCTPDETSVKPVLTGSGAYLPTDATGTVTLRCNVPNVMVTGYPWNAMEVVYKDTDGAAVSDQVIVELHKAGLNGQSESKIFTGFTTLPYDPSLLTLFDSNKVAAVSNSVQAHYITVNHSFDFSENAYYVLVKVKRSDLSRNPGALIIRLFAKGNIGG